MRRLLTRRNLLITGLATAGVGAAVPFARSRGLIPPDYGGIFGIGETVTYAAQRLLTSGQQLAREFPRSAISTVAPVNGPVPEHQNYRGLLANGFGDWRLTVDGMVARPMSFSLTDLKQMPAESHITLHVCEEGWSFIAEWTGVRLAHVLNLVGTKPEARYVVSMPFQQFDPVSQSNYVLWDSIDMADALHPQTLLAYGMNGEALPPGHGAPLRLRVSRQLGYKNIKYLYGLTLTDSMSKFGLGLGGSATDYGYSWYAGI